MAESDLNIENLTLRVPGLNEDDGRGLGEEILRRVADGLTNRHRSGHIGALDVRVSVDAGLSRERLVKEIAEAILGRLA